METLIEHIIADFHERKLPRLTPREISLPQLPGKIDTVIGMRRTGKTYFLYQILQDKYRQGLAKEQSLYINFDDERLLPLEADRLHLIVDTYYRLFPSLKNKTCYFFFDEIQTITGWQQFVRRLLDTENVQLILTGSSSKLLSKEIATSLRGRAIATEIFPFSFHETLKNENITLSRTTHPGAKSRALLANRMRQYLTVGGFPEVQTMDTHYSVRVLQEYVDVVILRDVIERYQVVNVYALRAMVRNILANPATLFSVTKFYHDLRSQGVSCTKNALYDYLDYLHDAYLIFPVSIFSRSERVRRTHAHKIYLIDTGLISAFLHQPQTDWGHLLENFVYLHLRRQNLRIAYYRTHKQTEVDFVTISDQGKKSLYQVALNLDSESTRLREVTALLLAMQECEVKNGIIITLDQRETIKQEVGTIEVYPVWQWVLQ